VERCAQVLAEFEAEALAAEAPEPAQAPVKPKSRRLPAVERRLMRLGLTRQHLAVSSAAEVIRVIRPKTDEKVVVALRRALIPCLSRMTSKSEG
jgi:hypothetical protein